MTPLRWVIIGGYGVFALVTIWFWRDLANGWSLLMAFWGPVSTFITALIALKFGVLLMALMSFLFVCLSSVVTLLVGISKVGVFKGVFIPCTLSGVRWICQKSSILQAWVDKLYIKIKTMGKRVYGWWKSKPWIDQLLLLGFIAPLIVMVSFAVLLKRFIYRFVSHTVAGRIVKKVISDFKRIPIVNQWIEARKDKKPLRSNDVLQQKSISLTDKHCVDE